MSHLYSNHPQWWNSNNDHKISESLSKGLSLRVDSPPQLHLNAMPLGFQLHGQLQDSSSSQSTQSNPDLTGTAAAGGSHSQDLCLSSESGQEVSGGSNFVGMKPVYMMGHPDTSCNTAQTNYGCTTTCTPHLGSDPYFNGYLTAYGPTPVIQNQMMGITAARVPLPLDVCEDEPIYVNAKQYHGILRRRQSRAKLEAQNKLIRARKPYLHESRHRHALNRVRGTGGRFLSKKELQQHSNSNVDHGNHSSSRPNQFGYDNVSPLGYESYHHQSQCVESGTSTMSSSSGYYQPSDGGFLGISSGGTMQRNGRVYG